MSSYIGWKIGKIRSPEYDNKTAALMYFNTYHELDLSSKNDIIIKLRSGNYKYVYSFKNKTLKKDLLAAKIINYEPVPRRNREEEAEKLIHQFGIFSGGITISALVKKGNIIADALKYSKRSRAFLVLLPIGLTVGCIGYYFGFEDEKQYDSPEYESVFKEEDMWMQYAETYDSCLNYGQLRINLLKNKESESNMLNILKASNISDDCKIILYSAITKESLFNVK